MPLPMVGRDTLVYLQKVDKNCFLARENGNETYRQSSIIHLLR